jgi:glycosyltransferase involved in cell wall biosynthesis
MPTILFIVAHRPNRSPSQRYRFEQYLDFFKTNGYDYEFSYIINEEDDKIFYAPGNLFKKFAIIARSIIQRSKDVYRANNFDIVFVQREALMIGSPFFEKRFSKSNAKLIFDFDDSLWLMDTSNANKKWEWLKSKTKTRQIISYAHLVLAGNEYLANFAKQTNSNVVVIPTTIDTQKAYRKTPYADTDSICIGWSGSVTTIKHFEEATPFLKTIKQRFGDKVYFKVMGDPNYTNSELGIKGLPWSSETENDILASFDIGIMPLPDDQWVKGKCGLKGLSYMALEVPTIMSAVGVNTSIIQDGENGFLASTEDEWITKLSALIESFELRQKLGKNGKQTVEEYYSVKSQQDKYIDCFNEVLKR